MKKQPISVTMPELKQILARYLDADSGINYAVKILGHPGIGKSDAVKQVALAKNFLFMDTRLAFKENVDLGGFPVPDHESRRMVYYRPRFIPPEAVPEGYGGILWFLDEANRAHPTVIQTLFQIITERVCGEHILPERTCVVLAGNLGEADETVVTEFDDSALDGRLAVFHLRPDAASWLSWAHAEKIHPSVIQYIARFPERLWDEAAIHPNPRGWHQVSQALKLSYGLAFHEALAAHLSAAGDHTLEKVIASLVGPVAADEFILGITVPRSITTSQVLAGDPGSMEEVRQGRLPVEDVLWALSGALTVLRERNLAGGLGAENGLGDLAHFLAFTGLLRADLRVSFFHRLVRQCGVFSQIPAALALIPDPDLAESVGRAFGEVLED
ncbi:MAG: hypothetical protein KKA60_01680 [Proteobacteria bacterium]|nr:hypothetical protein [Pseudomonadota bacterium]